MGACSKENKKAEETKPGPPETSPAEAGKATETPPTAPTPMGKDASAALAYLPEACALVVHIDLAAGFKNAALGKSLLPTLKAAFDKAKSEKEDMAAFFTSTGLDPFTDFHEMGLCLKSIPMNGEAPMGMGVVTGTAKPGLLTALVATSKKSEAFQPTKIGGVTGIERDGVIVVQLGDGTLLAGNDRSLLEAAVAKPMAQGATFGMIPKATMRIAVPTAAVKMVFNMPGSPFTSYASKIDGHSSFSADLDTRGLTLRIGTVSAEAATELAGIAKLLLGQVPKIPGEGIEAQAAASLSASLVKGEGKMMVGTMTIEEATLTQTLDKISKDIK